MTVKKNPSSSGLPGDFVKEAGLAYGGGGKGSILTGKKSSVSKKAKEKLKEKKKKKTPEEKAYEKKLKKRFKEEEKFRKKLESGQLTEKEQKIAAMENRMPLSSWKRRQKWDY